MFTGIIESLGKIVSLEKSKSNLEIFIESSLTPHLHIDQSLSHDGVCLTIDQVGPDWHRCTLIQETLNRTNFSGRKAGDLVNLERAMKLDSRLEGHLVLGHIDVALRCQNISDENGSWVFEFELPQAFSSLVIQKGSLTINGVSLTVSSISSNQFQVSIIPYTYEHTNFQALQTGDRVNIEFDLLGKYIYRHMEVHGVQGFR